MKLHELKPASGAKKAPKRKGRGIGSGNGKTAGKGHKGQLARSGGGKGPGFEGGQTPIQRRLPKRGFSNAMFKKTYTTVSLARLDQLDADSQVTPDLLLEKGMVKQVENGGIKVLADGEITKALHIKAHAFSQAAKEKIEAAGGTAEVIS